MRVYKPMTPRALYPVPFTVLLMWVGVELMPLTPYGPLVFGAGFVLNVICLGAFLPGETRRLR